MKLCHTNPFMRYSALQPSVISSAPLSCSYDHRLFFVEEGFATLVLGRERVSLCPGILIYLPSGTPYYFEGKVKVIVINFDFTRENDNIKKSFIKSKDIASFDQSLVLEKDFPEGFENAIILSNCFEVENRLEKCLLSSAYPSEVEDAQSSAIIKEVLCYIAKRQSSTDVALPEIVGKITLYIRQNYAREINNEEIGKALGYHSFYLNRVFKNSTGLTIHKAIIKERVRIAKRLLVETDLPVSAVATESGFCDQAQFSTAFRKYTTFTPLEYRKKKKI